MPKIKKISTINGIKGWLIFIIVIYHTYNNTDSFSRLFAPIKSYGGCFGNYMFFMLSGFLTAYSFSKKPVSERGFLYYISKKLIKLWPLYALCNLWQLGYNIYFSGLNSFCLSDFVLIMLMQTGGALTDKCPYIAHGWFLCTLFVCYVLNYFIRYLFKDDAGKYIWFFYGMVLWGGFLLTHAFDFPYCYVHDGEAFASFFVGSILVEHYNILRDKKHILYLVMIICCVCFAFRPLVNLGDFRLVFIIILCPGLIILAIEELPANFFFNCKLSQWLGSISMSVYFLHTISPLADIPYWFNDYSIGYFAYLFVVVVISGITTVLIRPIISKEPKYAKGLSYM